MTLTRPNDETLVNAQWVPATTGARARAVIIDCVLISILAVLLMGVSILVLNEPKLGLLAAILVVILLVREADLTLTGYSVGGRVAGVRFVDARTGGAPGIGMFFHADLVLVTIVPTLGFGSLLLLSSAAKSPDRRGWHDRISGLMVLSTKPGLEDEEEISASSLVSSGTLTEVPAPEVLAAPAAPEAANVKSATEAAAASPAADPAGVQCPETAESSLAATEVLASQPAPAPAFVPAEPAPAPVVESAAAPDPSAVPEAAAPAPAPAPTAEEPVAEAPVAETPASPEAAAPQGPATEGTGTESAALTEVAAAEAESPAAESDLAALAAEAQPASETTEDSVAAESSDSGEPETAAAAPQPSAAPAEQHAGPAYHSEVVPPLPEHGQGYGHLQDPADSAYAAQFVAVSEQDDLSNLDDSAFMVVPGDEAIGAPRSAPSPSDSDDHYELVQEVFSRRAAARNATVAASAAATDAVVQPGDEPEPSEPATAPAEEGTKAVNDTLIDASLVDGHTTDEPMIEVPEGESLDSYFAQALIAEDDSLSADSADTAPEEVVSAEGTEGPDPAFVDDRSEPVMRLMPFTNTGRAIHITGPTIIGRAPLNTSRYPEAKLVALGDQAPSVSKTHAAMMPTEHGILVTDLGSSNGTRVVRAGKARRIPTDVAVMVHEGGVVLLGQTAYRVQR